MKRTPQRAWFFIAPTVAALVLGTIALADTAPRSEKGYRSALVQAQARIVANAPCVFKRTGRMDTQAMRYFGHAPRIAGQRDVAIAISPSDGTGQSL